MPNRSPASTASDEGALTALTIGIPATAAFCTISNESRPLTWRTWSASGTRPARTCSPTTLSTALWRPTSSRTEMARPSG